MRNKEIRFGFKISYSHKVISAIDESGLITYAKIVVVKAFRIAFPMR